MTDDTETATVDTAIAARGWGPARAAREIGVSRQTLYRARLGRPLRPESARALVEALPELDFAQLCLGSFPVDTGRPGVDI